jgi:hypothetical protein
MIKMQLSGRIFVASIVIVLLIGGTISPAISATPSYAAVTSNITPSTPTPTVSVTGNITPPTPTPTVSVTGNTTPPTPRPTVSVTGNITLQAPPPKGNPKLDSGLNILASQNSTTSIGPLTAGLAPQTAQGTVRVIIEAKAGQTNNLTAAAAALGTVEGKYGNLVQMIVPTSKLTALSALSSAKFVRQPEKPLPSIISEGVGVINADDWQAASYNGTGVKIGILDIGFSGYQTRQSEGELPTGANLTTWWAPSIGNQGSEIHGTACAEIVYDMAPCATYYLANFSTDVEYGNAVNWLISQGVNIISCSVSWPVGGPGDGTGFFCQVIDSAKAAGIFWAQSIGNQAQRHWEGAWSNPGTNPNDVWNHFSGSDILSDITVTNGQLIVVALKWDDPWYSSSNDYDLLLYSSSLGSPVAYSTAIQNGDDEPWEALGYYATYSGTYYIAIGKLGSAAPVTFHLYSYYQNLEYQTAASSFTVPADSFSAVAVGAVNHSTPTTLESFSSRGPTDDGRIIPSLVAPDYVSTKTYGANAFGGTSASAPCTAGAAALVKGRFPAYTPAQIQTFLEGRAVDLGVAGKDNIYGAGRLDLGTASNNFTLTMTGGTNIIESVTVFVRTRSNAPQWQHLCLKTHGTIFEENAIDLSVWTTSSYTWSTNPQTGSAWTWDEINAMEIGVNLTGSDYAPDWSDCTQVYAEVKYHSGSVQNILTLRPSGNGSETSIDYATSAHYQCVNEAVPDEQAGYLRNAYGAVGSWQRDLFSLPDYSPSTGSGGGSITPLVGTYSYTAGTIVDITATPDSGWQFTSWTGDVTDPYSATTNVTMNTDKTVTANFNQTTGILTLAINGSGSVAPSVGSHDYTLGGNVTISAIPSSGWAFANWTGDVWNINSATTNVTMATNKTVIANFTRTDSVLRMAISGSGSVTPVPGNHICPINALVNITATPSSGWTFVNWTGGNVTSASSAATNTTMEWDKTIIAVFTKIPPPPPAPPSVSGGGGGGGGGGAGGINEIRITGLLGIISDEGKLALDVEAQSLDSKLTLSIPYGTFAKNKLGAFLTSITVSTLAEPNAPPANNAFIGSVYDLGPSGATFNPPPTFTIRYNDGDILEGISENDFYLATWDESAKSWSRIDFQLDTKTNLITTHIAHFSQYAVLVATGAAKFTLADINVSPSQIKTGESAVASVRVTNTGNLTGDYQAVLKINGAVQETKSITLDASANTTVSYNIVGGKAGTYSVDIGGMLTSFTVAGRPAAFKVESLTISPAEINPGEFASISVNVTNTSESEGKYALTLKINTSVVETKDITLDGAASQQVTFRATSDTPGKKIIEVDSLIGGLTVKGSVPPPSQIPLANTESAMKSSITPTTQVSAPTASPAPGTASKSNMWIFAAIAGGILVVAVCVLFITRRRKHDG